MDRAYNVIDSDGHVLEPLDLWQNYIDPAFRDRAPRLFIDEDGKERLRIDGKAFGGRRGLGTLGAVGARDGVVCDDTMTYNQGRKGGFDPHARIPDMDADGIDAAFLYPSIGLSFGGVEDPELVPGVVSRIQPLVGGLLQALSGSPLWRCDAAIAFGRAGDTRDAFCAQRARHARRLHPAKSIQ